MKVLLLTVLFMPPVYLLILWIVASTGEYFVLYLGIAMTILVMFFVVAVPTCLMPLFNKFEPIEKNELQRDIFRLAKDVDYPVSKIEVVDGSTRSGHSNAFLYGFGKIKKIVLFDTLLRDHLGFTDEAKEKRKDELAKENEDSNTKIQAEEEEKEPELDENG